MLGVKKINTISRSKKKLKIIIYLISFFTILPVFFFNFPKLLNFSHESIKENLKDNNNINVNSFSKVNYKIFPTPRLSIPNVNFTMGEGIIEIRNSDLEIILNISTLLNSKEVNYKKLLIKKGSSKIDFNNIDQLLAIFYKNKKEITFKKNNLAFFKNKKFFFEINNTLIRVRQLRKEKKLSINGNFLNNKIFINLDTTLKNKNNLTLKIPGLDIMAKIFFQKNNLGKASGFFNLEIYNNFLKFNFTKKDNIKLTDGFIRSKVGNSSVEGEVVFNPNFFLRLDFIPSNLNIEKLFTLIKKNYFSDNVNNLPLLKKINGIFNFKSKLQGKITNKNGEILFENFKVGKNQSFLLNARISEFGKKGKVHFNIVKKINYKKDLIKKIKIMGFLIPSNSKVIFQKILLNGSELSIKKTKEYENKFEDEVVQNYFFNIFYERKINKFLNFFL
jgi:hypothetical protein